MPPRGSPSEPATRCSQTRCPARAMGRPRSPTTTSCCATAGSDPRPRRRLVFRVGDLPTSKPLRAWLESLDGVPQVALDPEGAWQDPAAVLTAIHLGDPVQTLDSASPGAPLDPDWLASWRAADDQATSEIMRALGDELSEPLVAARLGEWLTARRDLVRRLLDADPRRGAVLQPRTSWRLGCSRTGARTGSTARCRAAFGVGRRRPSGPVVLLIGDVALAHDLGGLLAARRLRPRADDRRAQQRRRRDLPLPPGRRRDATRSRQHVATPHGLEFAHAAALYGCAYARADHRRGAALRDRALGIGSAGTTIIEVRTDRDAEPRPAPTR